MKIKSAELLSGEGPFADQIKNFQARPHQQAMAELIETSLQQDALTVIESSSGSGKTLAYLVPVFTSNKKAIISTATHYLQNQLVNVDIPVVQKALGSTRSVAVLKGRSSYVCPYYLKKNLHSENDITRKDKIKLTKLWQHFVNLKQVDLSVLSTSLTIYATSTSEDCLANDCPEYQNCPFIAARLQAERADIIVINHSLLFADAVLKRELDIDNQGNKKTLIQKTLSKPLLLNKTSLNKALSSKISSKIALSKNRLTPFLPAAEFVIVDEAHRLAEFAQTIVGSSLSSWQLRRFCRDAIKALSDGISEQQPVLRFLLKFQQALTRIQLNLPSINPYYRYQHIALVDQLLAGLKQFSNWLETVMVRDHILKELFLRCELLCTKLREIKQDDGLCWLQQTPKGFLVQHVPADVSHSIQQVVAANNSSWLFTSATISVAGDASQFLQTLGLTKAQFYRFETPFNYLQKARLYTPKITVAPDHEKYADHLLATVLPLLKMQLGRVLFLFTSHRALQAMANLLRQKGVKELLVQGEADNSQLVSAFKQSPNGVLLGTGSFWEGLDLSSSPLSLVIIDKLPFSSPAEPLVQLKSFELSAHGVDSFEHYLLPDAVIRLRQGCGRLLRRIEDSGVIMLADPRLHSRSYAQVFIDSLPPMERVNELSSLSSFLEARNNGND